MAERLISFKKKLSEEWLEKQYKNKEDTFAKSDSENESESDGEPPKKEIILTKKKISI